MDSEALVRRRLHSSAHEIQTKIQILDYRLAENRRIPGVPTGIRTPVTAVRGRCPRPLDDGDRGKRRVSTKGSARDQELSIVIE